MPKNRRGVWKRSQPTEALHAALNESPHISPCALAGFTAAGLAVGALFVALSTAASALVATPVSAVPARSKTPTATATGLDRPGRKEIAMKLVSSAENSTLAWRKQYRYISYDAIVMRRPGHRPAEQRGFLRNRNFDLAPPLIWHVYGDRYRIPGWLRFRLHVGEAPTGRVGATSAPAGSGGAAAHWRTPARRPGSSRALRPSAPSAPQRRQHGTQRHREPAAGAERGRGAALQPGPGI